MPETRSYLQVIESVREWLAAEAPSLADRADAVERIDLELDELLDVSRRFAAALAGRAEVWDAAAVRQLEAELAEKRRELIDRWVQAVLAVRLTGVRLRPENRQQLRRGEARAHSGMFEARDRNSGAFEARERTSSDLVVPAMSPSGSYLQLDDSQRQRLQAALSGQFPAVTAAPQVFPAQLAQAVRAELGEVPPALDNEEAVRAELKLLVRCTRPERQDGWRSLPPDVQVSIIAHLAARARCLQEPPAAQILTQLDVDRQIETLFNALSRYTKEEAPGFVYGLARSHGARSESWHKDAMEHLNMLNELIAVRAEPAKANPEREIAKLEQMLADEAGDDAVVEQLDAVLAAGVTKTDARLVRLCRPKLELLGKHARFKPLRKAIKEVDESDENPDKQTGPAADWPHWAAVRGKRAALIGGEPREEPRARIQAAFEFAALSWESIDQVRQIDALANQIRSGGVDFMIILQSFVNHSVCGKIVDACRSAKVPFAAVERGYGVERIRLAIEQDLGKRAAD